MSKKRLFEDDQSFADENEPLSFFIQVGIEKQDEKEASGEKSKKRNGGFATRKKKKSPAKNAVKQVTKRLI